jgi:hypothetical protein
MTYLEAHPVAGMLCMPLRGARRVPAAIAAARSNCFGSRPQKGCTEALMLAHGFNIK